LSTVVDILCDAARYQVSMVGLQANRSSVVTIGRDYTGKAEYMAYEDAKTQFSTLQRNLNVRYVTLILLSV